MQEIIQMEIKDPRIHPMTSVTKVEVAPDLKTCRAYISVLGDDEALSATVTGLKAAEGFIRHQLAVTVNLRNTPEIHFIPDSSIAYGVDMSRKIRDVMKADEEARIRSGRTEEDAGPSADGIAEGQD